MHVIINLCLQHQGYLCLFTIEPCRIYNHILSLESCIGIVKSSSSPFHFPYVFALSLQTPVLVTPPPWRKRVINSTSSRSRSPSSMSSLEKPTSFGLIVNQGIFGGIFWIAWLEVCWGQVADWTKIIQREWFLHLVLSDPFFEPNESRDWYWQKNGIH